MQLKWVQKCHLGTGIIIRHSVLISFLLLSVKIRDGVQSSLQRILEESGGTFFTTNILLQPKSRGTIRLQSTDPFDPPLIDPNYLDHPDDITNFMKGRYSFF